MNDPIYPFDFRATHVLWFSIWRNFVQSVRNLPHDKYLGHQACQAQMKYLTHAAIYVVDLRNKHS